MPRKLNRLTLAIVPLIAIALSANACAVPHEVESIGAYQRFDGSSAADLCEGTDWATGGFVRGPYFTFEFGCRYAGTTVPSQIANASKELAAVEALESGVLLLVAQFKSASNGSPADDETTVIELQVGDERFTLETMPEKGDFLAVTVPVDEAVVFLVEFQGRAQGVDLFTGDQIDAVPYYNGDISNSSASTAGYSTGRVDVSSGDMDAWLSCDFTPTVSSRPWLEKVGWAKNGRLFLDINLLWCKSINGFTWELDHQRAWRLTEGGVEPVAWWEVGQTGDQGLVRTHVVFEVPAGATEFAFAFAPVGQVTGPEGERFEFREEPEVTELTVSF